MFSFSTMKLVAWIFFICIETSTSRIVRRELTDQQIEIDSDVKEDFPSVLPVFLKSLNRIVKLNFTKQYLDYNIPVYTRQKDGSTILLDTPPITNVGFYEDPSYEASVTLHCEENDPLSSSRDACNAKLMSGFFDLDGHRHVIEPKERIFKRFVMYLDQNSREKFAERHQVFKIYSEDQSCGVEGHDHSHFNSTINSHINSHINSGNERPKRNRIKNTIEVMSAFTHKMPINQEEIKARKLYYTHVFWGVNKIYNQMNMKEMSFGVNLLGFILEPDETSLYVFPDPNNRTGHLDHRKTLRKLMDLKRNYPSDHLTLFSIHNLDPNPGVVGYAQINAMCHDTSVSIIRNQGHFQEIFILAHEIGHSLSCSHDSENNNCPQTGGYVMGAVYFGNPTKQQSFNHYKFSNCSVDYIRNYVTNLKPNCLLTPIKMPLVPHIPTGQLYPIWKQCLTMSDKVIGVCPYREFRNTSTICLSIWCDIGHFQCMSYLPAFKTTCGNKKWCLYGHCIYDDRAPLADESCLHGDAEKLGVSVKLSNGTSYYPKSCTELIKLTPGFCKNSTHRRKCCDTCFQLAHPGNRIPTTQLITTTTTTELITTMQTTVPTSAHTELKSHFFTVALAVWHLFLFGRYFLS